MIRLSCLAATIILLASCNGNSNKGMTPVDRTRDSLQNVIDQKDSEIDDMMATLNDIQEGFREINEAEDRVTLANTGEKADRKALIRENIVYIQDQMQQNRQLINKLQQQIRESSYQSEHLKKTVTSLLAQLADKDEQLKVLRAQLDDKDIKIRELDDKVERISEDLTQVSEESSNKSTQIAQHTSTIARQDKELNTAYFVFGTKKELTSQKILDGGKLSFSNFNRDYFTKIDIRVDKEIKLYSKSAKILSYHPADSYTLTQDAKKQYVLRINDPETFWSSSKYLVVVVK